MQLTPEQKEQVGQAKANDVQRVMLAFTAEQKKAWQSAAGAELAAKEENIARFRKIKAAAEQPGFFGDVRRAVLLSRCSVNEMAGTIGVDTQVFSDFRAGEAELPPAAIDRLVAALGLRLMQEIPR